MKSTGYKHILKHLLVLAACVAVSVHAADTAATSSLTSLTKELKTSSKASGDSTLASLGGELASKVQALSKSLGTNTAAKTQLETALQSLAGGKSADSVGAFAKLSEAKLTPEQTKLAKEVKDVGSAYIVQKNFASLEGSQTEVAQIVNSLRKGQATAALPSIKKVAQNANLTQPQKDLLTSVAEKYTPGLGKASESLKGLKNLSGFGK